MDPIRVKDATAVAAGLCMVFRAFARRIEHHAPVLTVPRDTPTRDSVRAHESSSTAPLSPVCTTPATTATLSMDTLPASPLLTPAPTTEPDRPSATLEMEEVHLSAKARERAVPSGRLSRMFHYGTLALGLSVDVAKSTARRTLLGDNSSAGALLSPESADRLVTTLCRMRGAALKLGQMISIQDNGAIPDEILRVFDRVRQSADYMPQRQLDSALSSELGSEWRTLFTTFDRHPIAAASLGQVHSATIALPSPDPTSTLSLSPLRVAVKVQYPGVAQSISSDLSAVQSLLNLSGLLPKGLFLETMLSVARDELAWEVDYLREMEFMERFRSVLDEQSGFVVPRPIGELTTERVLVSEFAEGVSLEHTQHFSQETRNRIAERMLELCLRELFEFQFMQTDPNWSNFLYSPKTDQITLLDFGASRAFDDSFLDPYLRTIECASVGDREGVTRYSHTLGYLTGNETQPMVDAHTESVMLLARPFATDLPFDFYRQDVTSKVRQLIPVMLHQRLTAPPRETYSLHRKLSGTFLLCARLRANISCGPVFRRYSEMYRARLAAQSSEPTSRDVPI